MERPKKEGHVTGRFVQSIAKGLRRRSWSDSNTRSNLDFLKVLRFSFPVADQKIYRSHFALVKNIWARLVWKFKSNPVYHVLLDTQKGPPGRGNRNCIFKTARIKRVELVPGVHLGILGGGEPPGYPRPPPISDQKMSFFAPFFRLGLQNPYPFSNLASKKLCHWSFLKLEHQQKQFLNSQIWSHFSYSFGIERINTLP